MGPAGPNAAPPRRAPKARPETGEPRAPAARRSPVEDRSRGLHVGEEVRLDVTIHRRADYTKDVTIDVLLSHLGGVHGNPLPPGVTVVDGKSKTALRAGANLGHIVLKAAPTAAPIENVPICVLAHVSINFVVKVSYASAPIPVTVQK